MASMAEERMAMTIETSDTTATEVEGSPGAQPKNARALKVAGAATAAVLAAGALVAGDVAAASATSRFALDSSGNVELQGITVSAMPGTGCSNWDKIYIDTLTGTTLAECAQKCSQTVGCAQVNFQDKTKDQCTSGGDATQNTCYLFKGNCVEEANACWTLGTVTRAYPVDPEATYREGVGCTNWASIIFDRSVQATRMECAKLCAETAGCVSINFQGLKKEDCTPPDQGAGQNSCYLFNATCIEEPNNCWAAGYMKEPGTSATTVAMTTTTDGALTTV